MHFTLPHSPIFVCHCQHLHFHFLRRPSSSSGVSSMRLRSRCTCLAAPITIEFGSSSSCPLPLYHYDTTPTMPCFAIRVAMSTAMILCMLPLTLIDCRSAPRPALVSVVPAANSRSAWQPSNHPHRLASYGLEQTSHPNWDSVTLTWMRWSTSNYNYYCTLPSLFFC